MLNEWNKIIFKAVKYDNITNLQYNITYKLFQIRS